MDSTPIEEVDVQILNQLCEFDTPTITNVVATYPGHPLCLELYDPWSADWYTNQQIRCIYPELGARIGYAVTCTFGLPGTQEQEYTFADVLVRLGDMPRPTVLIINQQFPDEIKDKVGLTGGLMATALGHLGCQGILTNGPVRDVDEVRPMKFQYLATGITPGHGPLAVHSIGDSVTICGLKIRQGDLIHMDENGACKFPSSYADQVLQYARKMRAQEAIKMEEMKMENDVAKIAQILGRGYAK